MSGRRYRGRGSPIDKVPGTRVPVAPKAIAEVRRAVDLEAASLVRRPKRTSKRQPHPIDPLIDWLLAKCPDAEHSLLIEIVVEWAWNRARGGSLQAIVEAPIIHGWLDACHCCDRRRRGSGTTMHIVVTTAA